MWTFCTKSSQMDILHKSSNKDVLYNVILYGRFACSRPMWAFCLKLPNKGVSNVLFCRERSVCVKACSVIEVEVKNKVVDKVSVAKSGDGEVVNRVRAVVELAFRCATADKNDRPDAREVVAKLKRIWSQTCSGSGRGEGLKEALVEGLW
ncbi:LEAF RUST 10 DISEASE-RESISTANCE LOCUS RECEPTOR-LIKE PROTEIN KINASE-like 1.5 [Camellia lanceoleosa]|uniref:LEAF RUST 10 DISEASE-RESISTANCE LOCUS RECEPTOR-LIKE PROTEIN KINASE-like 1.5 n=1 Tax=Camellia lanceoleosa TaxID=1840588 RepID=A0ACC0FC75_9ERIC|nr:LEAF RUST 10 DISEASE-RESISTANCE LOCUS RECEPTOR-LIKE PROTEIN KINASE-like 1.5 [Camellia lanceoleosa]